MQGIASVSRAQGRSGRAMARREDAAGKQLATRIGFWAAVLATAFSVSFGVAAVVSSVVSPTAEWSGIEAFVASFDTVQVIPVLPPLLLAPAFVALMACIHHCASSEERVLSQLGLAFAVVYTAIIWIIDYVQLTVVRQNVLSGVTEGLALWALPNPHSLFFALEAIGYGFMGLSTLVVAPLFGGGRIERWIRWLFVANGLMSIAGVVGYAFGDVTLVFAGLPLWCLEFPIAMALVSAVFRRARQAAG